jgi:ATP/maltotriose-dependent transcriptional regulator MalT
MANVSLNGLGAEPLSERELEVLQVIAIGASNREIGQQLYITENTVKRHVYNIFGKLQVSNRTQAALRAGELSQTS